SAPTPTRPSPPLATRSAAPPRERRSRRAGGAPAAPADSEPRSPRGFAARRPNGLLPGPPKTNAFPASVSLAGERIVTHGAVLPPELAAPGRLCGHDRRGGHRLVEIQGAQPADLSGDPERLAVWCAQQLRLAAGQRRRRPRFGPGRHLPGPGPAP